MINCVNINCDKDRAEKSNGEYNRVQAINLDDLTD